MSRASEPSIYDCSICLGVPDGEVHQCRSGHLFCEPCLAVHCSSGSRNSSSSRCPVCRVVLQTSPIRCLSAEQAIASMPTACQHCAKGMSRGQLKGHLPACPRRPVACSAEACKAVVPCDELPAHERSCVHAACAAALGRIEATLRAELRETEGILREEYRRAVVEEHVMAQFRDCARHPPGPGFRVELVRPDADVGSAYCGRGRPAPSGTRDADGYHNRLLCLVPGSKGTIHEGGCYPVLLVYSTAEPFRGRGLSGRDALREGSKSTSFRMRPPRARLPPSEGPEVQARCTSVSGGCSARDRPMTLAWGEAQPSAEEPATGTETDNNTTRAKSSGFYHPNVYPSGTISLSTLIENQQWHPSMTAAEILLSIQSFLDNPNFGSPSQLLHPQHMGKAYEQRVREQAARYTSEVFDLLVREYCLPPITSARPNGIVEPEWTADGQHRIIIGIGC